ncbi:MAG: hypothetical protein ASARMPRED_004983 [Alectoria sarmentosa]|nr:MAG: hypothetical protein ASARMPRED_004983 [Alectoria sarmentosa]
MARVNAGLHSNVPADDGDADPLHVLDLPQLYSKPSAQSLLSALALLAVAPSSWDVKACEAGKTASIDEDGVPSYLTRIISSPLAWIPEGADKEDIWEAASKRLAERSGRTAMPSVSRTFKIPLDGQDTSETVDIKLHEPSLTGDNLGHKTWVASYLLAKRLPLLLPRLFPGIKTSSEMANPHLNPWAQYPKDPHHPRPITPSPPPTRPHILELGAGTGLVGLAASALFATHTHLTDLPSILPNLQTNVAKNASLTTSSTVTAGPLDWSDRHSSVLGGPLYYDLILAADSLYAPEHPTWLVRVMGARLRRDEERRARVVLELPFRSETPPEHEKLREMTLAFGLAFLFFVKEMTLAFGLAFLPSSS